MNRNISLQLMPFLKGTALKRGAIFGMILFAALLSFEVFNFSTTQFALHDMLGDLTFAGLRWASVLAFAFCGIDFAGIARIFTPEQGRDEPAEVWYLFGAWLLAAGFNATLTWWGVSVAIINNQSIAGSVLLSKGNMTTVVPVMVAIMVWLIRVLIISTFSVAGERLFTLADDQPANHPFARRDEGRSQPRPAPVNTIPAASYARPAPKPYPTAANAYTPRPEPAYHPVGMTAAARNENTSARR
jgi:hypothetical protein